MNVKSLLMDYRIIALLIVVIVSASLVGVVGLNFGMELDGGTRVQLNPVGQVVTTGGGVPTENVTDFETMLSEALSERTDPTGNTSLNVRVRQPTTADGNPRIEVGGNISNNVIRQVLSENGVEVTGISEGLTEQTLDDLRATLETRIERSPQFGAFSGIQVERQTNILTNEAFIVVEVPGVTNASSDIIQILKTRGSFELRVETGNNTTELVFDGSAIQQASPPQRMSGSEEIYRVTFTPTEEGAQRFIEKMRSSGATQNPREHRLLTVYNGEEVGDRVPLAPDFAQSIEEGSYQGGSISIRGIDDRDVASQITAALRSGELPAPVVVASSDSVSAAQGEQFKTFSLIAGIFAVFTVGAVIYWRYREIRIAVPMVLTGLAEVLAVLGFVAAVNLSLDLSHIAGLIAVVGTGVDDLVIIADEVLAEGDVKSSNIYQKRFRRAFIIIAMAAVTTIGAMLPLAFLGLGRIRGFAIVTIVGVLIGILITRPAYGSILRELLTDV